MSYARECYAATLNGWNRFWFTTRDPATLGVVRICTGLMLLYTHAVWTLDWLGFFGFGGWLDAPARAAVMPRVENYSPFVWSHFDFIENDTALWSIHLVGLGVFALLTLGLFTRVMSIAAWLLTISYMRRDPLALFGLDGINSMLAMYLMIGPAGAAFSLDSLFRKKRATPVAKTPTIAPRDATVGANLSIRLIQTHMCLIYFFSALGKLKGDTWWAGDALWLAVGNLEYQSVDATWTAAYPRMISALTLITVFWELSYAVLIWPRLTRPIMLLIAVGVHLGIGIWMGMMTFGLAMLIGNLAFVESATIRWLSDRLSSSDPEDEYLDKLESQRNARRKTPFISRKT